MFAQMLQIFGALGLLLSLVVLAARGHVAFAVVIGALMAAHFVGDYFKLLLKRNDPIVLAGYNISLNLNPGPFLLHVGGALLISAFLFALTGHRQWAGATGGWGIVLYITGMVGSIIYDPNRSVKW